MLIGTNRCVCRTAFGIGLCWFAWIGLAAAVGSGMAGGTASADDYFRLSTREGEGSGLSLEATGTRGATGTTVSLQPTADVPTQVFRVVPVGEGLARIQGLLGDGSIGAATANRADGPIRLTRQVGVVDELWRIIPVDADPGAVWCESVAFPGRFASHDNRGRVGLLPFQGAASQAWVFLPTGGFAPAFPAMATQGQQIQLNPPLEPVEITLTNSHSNTLIVLFADRRPGGTVEKFEIPAGGAQPIIIERDSGATLLETYDQTDPFGNIQRQEFATAIPPAVLYDISVYELWLQSIAIDRTGKSPNPIEDVNYQPKSIGFFLIPPGDQPLEGNLDVFTIARRAENPGGVRPMAPSAAIPPEQSDKVLKDLLDQVRRGIRN
jgi:hypothetical protein